MLKFLILIVVYSFPSFTQNEDTFPHAEFSQDGTTIPQDTTTILEDGTTILQDGTTILQDGTTIPHDTTIFSEDTTTDSPTTTPMMSTAPRPETIYKLGHAKPTFQPLPVPQKFRARIVAMDVFCSIQNRYATTRINSTMKNPHTRISQLTAFDVTIPEEAVISNFSMSIKGKNTYVAEIREKDDKDFISSVKDGQTAAYVEARGANNFKVHVNIEPESVINFFLTYEELLQRKRGYYEQRIFLGPGRIVGNFSIEIRLSETRYISDFITQIDDPKMKTIEENVGRAEHFGNQAWFLYNPTELEQLKEAFEAGGNPNDGLKGSYVMKYDVERGDVKDVGEIHVVEKYFAHFMAPDVGSRVAKHLILVIDVSGSMSGQKLHLTKNALKKILSSLHPEDWFSLITFESSVWVWDSYRKFEVGGIVTEDSSKQILPVNEAGFRSFPGLEVKPTTGPWEVPEKSYVRYPIPAIQNKIENAKLYIDDLKAEGATNIQGALKEAMKHVIRPLEDTDRLTQILFLTDGEATVGETNSTKILNSITKLNIYNASVYSVAFGYDDSKSGADWNFLKKLSYKNFGFARKVYHASDADVQLINFYEEISELSLLDIEVKYVQEDHPSKVLLTNNYRTYYKGSELVFSGPVPDASQLHVKVTAQSNEGRLLIETFPMNFAVDNFEGIHSEYLKKQGYYVNLLERMHGYRTVKMLLKEILLCDNKTQRMKLKKRVVDLALKFNFLTEVTSMIVFKPNSEGLVEEEVVDIKHTMGKRLVVTNRFDDLIYSHIIQTASRLSTTTKVPTTSDEAMTEGTTTTEAPSTTTQSSSDQVYTFPSGINIIPSFDVETGVVVDPSFLNNAILLNQLVPPPRWENVTTDHYGTATFPNGTTIELGYQEDELPVYEPCTTESGEPGTCRYIQYCYTDKYMTNLDAFWSNTCTVESPNGGVYAGVCCPDTLTATEPPPHKFTLG